MSDAVVIALITAVPPTIVGLVSVIVSLKNTKKLDVMHESVNGLLKEKTEADKKIGIEQGVQQEKADQKDRDDSK